MKWNKLSNASCLSILAFTILLLCGILPLLLLHDDIADKKELLEISDLVERLEKEHEELTILMTSLEADYKQSEVNLSSHQPFEPKETTQINDFAVFDQIAVPGKTFETPSIFPRPITFNTPSSTSAESVLVVGGTDGSGTRRVVQILTQLGVTMVSEDPETYDIHGDIVGGWPHVVTPVLEYTRNIAYELTELPERIRRKISGDLQSLLNLVESDSRKLESHTLAVGGALRKPPNIKVSGVKYGFKAPVAMTLAPFWAFLLKDFRMLHVLRDGRDIAFSANQGPVQKFFSTMYRGNQIPVINYSGRNVPTTNIPLTQERLEIKAIQLWSDWNLGLRKWAEEKVKSYSNGIANNGKSFGYYAIHSEDLVDEDRNVRYSALVNLASWIRSDISDKDLCCIAVSGSKFLGSHDKDSEGGNEANTLTSRYGKWKARLSADPSLSQSMLSIGGPALKEFGYEPLRSFLSSKETVLDKSSESVSYANFKSINRPRCTLQPNDCTTVPIVNDVKEEIEIDLNLWTVPNVCTVIKGVDYKGADIDQISITTIESGFTAGSLDYTMCCRQCQRTSTCRNFTIDVEKNICYLKSSKGRSVRTGMTSGLISGDLI